MKNQIDLVSSGVFWGTYQSRDFFLSIFNFLGLKKTNFWNSSIFYAENRRIFCYRMNYNDPKCKILTLGPLVSCIKEVCQIWDKSDEPFSSYLNFTLLISTTRLSKCRRYPNVHPIKNIRDFLGRALSPNSLKKFMVIYGNKIHSCEFLKLICAWKKIKAGKHVFEVRKK